MVKALEIKLKSDLRAWGVTEEDLNVYTTILKKSNKSHFFESRHRSLSSLQSKNFPIQNPQCHFLPSRFFYILYLQTSFPHIKSDLHNQARHYSDDSVSVQRGDTSDAESLSTNRMMQPPSASQSSSAGEDTEVSQSASAAADETDVDTYPNRRRT